MSQIANIVIPCFVIQQNNEQFILTQGVVGLVRNVDCRNVFIDDDLYWASPIKDEGIFSGWQYRIAVGENAAQPTFDSFYVQRIRDKISGYTWWVYVTSKDDFKNSCNTCCGDSEIPMPGVNGGFAPVIAPCQLLCDMIDVNGDLYALFGIPSLPAGSEFYATGSYNNEALPSSSSSFATVAELLAYINSNWTNVGSPNVTFVWTASVDELTLTATGGISGDSLCVTIYTIAPSP